MTDTNFIKPLEDFVQGALDTLPEYLKKENTQKFLRIFLERLETVDNAVINMAEFRLLANAEGVFLDEIGEQIGVFRNGQSDNDYRTILLIRQLVAGKGGTRPEVSDALNNLFSSTAWYMYKGTNYRIDIYASSPCFELTNIVEDIVDLFPVITHLRVVETDYNQLAFGFDGDDTALGFSGSNDRLSENAGMLGGLRYTSDKATHSL